AVGFRSGSSRWRSATLFEKSRRCVVGNAQFGVQGARPDQKHSLGLGIGRVRNTTINRAHCRACFMVVKANAFGALGRNDVVDVLSDGRAFLAIEFPFNPARINRGIRALGLARTAVDALARDSCRHQKSQPRSAKKSITQSSKSSSPIQAIKGFSA